MGARAGRLYGTSFPTLLLSRRPFSLAQQITYGAKYPFRIANGCRAIDDARLLSGTELQLQEDQHIVRVGFVMKWIVFDHDAQRAVIVGRTEPLRFFLRRDSVTTEFALQLLDVTVQFVAARK